jgi:shikimate kinase
MKKDNITLIGMPGAGKTYLGQKIADQFKMRWVDLDVVDYKDVLKRGNENDYLRLEEKVLLDTEGNYNVFSCSGSSVYSKKGMNHLKDISQVIYLKLPFIIIKKRLGNYSSRGIVKSENINLEEIYKERISLYKRYADYIVNCKIDSTDEQFKKLCRVVTSVILPIFPPTVAN